MGKFNKISFNEKAFGAYVEKIPKLRKDYLLKSGVLVGNENIRKAFSSQTGTMYAQIPFYGNISGTALNYDGKTPITAQETATATQGVVVVGRAQAFKEDDFAKDITGGVDFMGNVARQISDYWDEVDQTTLVAILEGIFKMNGGQKTTDFVDNHKLDLTANLKETEKFMNATTLNTVMQKACGGNKNAFSLAIMHSFVATNLENLNLLEYMKYTDENGIQRNLNIATLNGRIVIIDDSATFESANKYITYVLGKGAIAYENIGAKVPYEIHRDPKTNGGQNILYARQRKCFAPFGITYLKKQQPTDSPTDDNLKNEENWRIIGDDDNHTNNEIIDHRMIPIAKIVSKG